MERVKARMRKLNMSHQYLADALGMTRGAIGHYLAGRRKPDLAQLQRMAKVLGVHPAWLMFGLEAQGVAEEKPDYGMPLVSVTLAGTTNSGPGVGAEERVTLPLVADGCYALSVVGSDYVPRIKEGEVVLISPERLPEVGDEVLVGFADGTFGLLCLLEMDSEALLFESLTDPGERRSAAIREIVLLHPMIAVFKVESEK